MGRVMQQLPRPNDPLWSEMRVMAQLKITLKYKLGEF